MSRYSMPTPGSLWHRPLFKWGFLFGFWLVVGVIFVGHHYIVRLAAGGSFDAGMAFWIILGWATWIPLTPLIVWLARRYPIERRRWIRRVFCHLGMACLVVLADVMIFIGLRLIVVTLTGTAGPEAFQSNEALNMVRFVWDILLRSFFFDVLIYSVIVAVVHALDYYRRYRKRNLRTAQLEAQLAQAQVQALRMQLNPHFLFNTLHTISSMMDESVPEARRMIIDLSDLLRQSLECIDDHEIPLEEELSLLERYLSIETTRFHDRLSVEVDIPPGTRRALVPSLILQPLVENAIKHGIAPYAAPGHIMIRARHEGDRLILQVQDSGPGMRKSQQRTGRQGIGVRNTRERLMRLYGQRQHLKLQNLPEGGFVAEAALPFRPADTAQPVLSER